MQSTIKMSCFFEMSLPTTLTSLTHPIFVANGRDKRQGFSPRRGFCPRLMSASYNALWTKERTQSKFASEFGTGFESVPQAIDKTKKDTDLVSFFVLWLGNKDSNPDIQSQSLLCYRYTIPQYCFLRYQLYHRKICLSIIFLKL